MVFRWESPRFGRSRLTALLTIDAPSPPRRRGTPSWSIGAESGESLVGVVHLCQGMSRRFRGGNCAKTEFLSVSDMVWIPRRPLWMTGAGRRNESLSVNEKSRGLGIDNAASSSCGSDRRQSKTATVPMIVPRVSRYRSREVMRNCCLNQSFRMSIASMQNWSEA